MAHLRQHKTGPPDVFIRYYLTETWIATKSVILTSGAKPDVFWLLVLLLGGDRLRHSIAYFLVFDESPIISIRSLSSIVHGRIAFYLIAHGLLFLGHTLKHFMGSTGKPLLVTATLFAMVASTLLILIVINHRRVDTHALDHATTTPLRLVIAVLVMKFFY